MEKRMGSVGMVVNTVCMFLAWMLPATSILESCLVVFL